MNNEDRLAEIAAMSGHSPAAIQWALENKELQLSISELLRRFLEAIDFAKETSDTQIELFLDYVFADRAQLRKHAGRNPRNILESFSFDERLAVYTCDFGKLRKGMPHLEEALAEAIAKTEAKAHEWYAEHQRNLANQQNNHRTLEDHRRKFPGDSYRRFCDQGLIYLAAFTELTAMDLRAIPWIGNATILKLMRLFETLDCRLKDN